MARENPNSMDRNGSDDRRLRRETMRQGEPDYVNVGVTERIASAVAGGFLTMFGLRRRGTAGYGMALLGAELLYRGTSGHCKTYSVLGVSTKEPNRQVRQALERFEEVAEGRVVRDADGLVVDEYSDDAFTSADGMDALDRPGTLDDMDVLAEVADDGDGIAEIVLSVSHRNDVDDDDLGVGGESMSTEELEDATIGHELKGAAGVTRDDEVHGERMFDSPDGKGRETPEVERN